MPTSATVKIRVAACLIREEWGPDNPLVKRAGGAIYTACLYRPDVRVHCCELTPSYELHPVAYAPLILPETQLELEALCVDIDEAGEFSPIYSHCARVDRLPLRGRFASIEPSRIDLGEWEGDDEAEAWERALDHYRGNSLV